METTTAKLSKALKSPKDIRAVLEENELSFTAPTLKEHLSGLLSLKGLSRQDVIKKAEIDVNYANQLFNGIRTKPGRDQILALAFGFELSREETERLLRIAGTGALYPKNKRDAVIIHSLENGKTMAETNGVLVSLGLGAILKSR